MLKCSSCFEETPGFLTDCLWCHSSLCFEKFISEFEEYTEYDIMTPLEGRDYKFWFRYEKPMLEQSYAWH